jgi:Protein of unknown function (DUF2924)
MRRIYQKRRICVNPKTERSSARESETSGSSKSRHQAAFSLTQEFKPTAGFGSRARIGAMNIDQLRAAWREVYPSDPPPAFSKDLLARAIAFHAQQKALGGLSPATARLLRSLIKPGVEPPRQVKVGSVIVREHQGVVHEVLVVPGGLCWQGKSRASSRPSLTASPCWPNRARKVAPFSRRGLIQKATQPTHSAIVRRRKGESAVRQIQFPARRPSAADEPPPPANPWASAM